MKKTNKIITIIMLVAILTMSLFVSTVNAAVTIGASDSNRTVAITRNVNGVTNPVTNTFTYTIALDSSYGAGATSGAVSDYPTSTTIAFNGVAPEQGATTVSQNGSVDFAGTTFNKVGDYRFILTESASSNPTKYPVDGSTYYLYVSVRFAANDQDGTQMVATVVGSGMKGSTAAPTQATKQPVVFESEPTFTNISISKTVSGNMGDKSEYFDVSVTVDGETGDTYTVSGGSHTSNPATITAGTATTLKIKHGETITVGLSGTTKQIPVGAQYTVAETAVTGYTTTIDTVEQSSVTKTTVETPASNATAIVNNYELATLTGTFLNIMPYVVIALAVIILIALVVRSSKNKKEE